MTPHAHQHGFHGPKCWTISAVIGLAAGAAVAGVIPADIGTGGDPSIPLWLVAPFAALLASIALMPFTHARVWHLHYPDFAFALGGLVAGYYLLGLHRAGHAYGSHHLLHALLEYYSFIALVGGLFVVSGAILVDVRGRGTPLSNTVLLLLGAVLANVVGTTGASMLLIRPYMRINRGRLHPVHIVFFLFIVSNCGGCLTPIGDPPLYLGYLKGVPFLWTLEHMWRDWALIIGMLLAAFVTFDLAFARRARATFSRLATTAEAEHPAETDIRSSRGILIKGSAGIVCLVLIVAGVFIDPLLKRAAGIEGWPVGATFQILVAMVAHRMAPREILAANDFNFGPVKEVGLLFLGIFVTMMPALAYLSEHGKQLGIDSPTAFYFATGALSAVLDNAPTYLNFLQIAFGPTDINAATVGAFLADRRGVLTLDAISTGAVFFGAMTYIGNGPNFMVKAIAEGAGVRMPSFFGYLGYAIGLLLPVVVIHWLLLIR